MPSCCYTDDYGALFSERAARRTARRFARRGLRGSARRLADAVAAAGIAGAPVLEVGGGVGDLHADLLRRGAASAVNVELSPNWEQAAQHLLAELGLAGRVTRHVGDFVDLADDLPDAEAVVLHRVLCCYPDWRAMLDASMRKARRVVGITVPVDHWGSRVAVRIGNALLKLQGRAFRAYVHPVARVAAALEAAGYRAVVVHRGPVWHTLVAERGVQ